VSTVSIGKMRKLNLMLKRPVLRRYLPETYWFTPEKALSMLKSYSTIFIKPDKGSGGSGIIRVRRTRNGYEVRCHKKRKYVRSKSLYKAIQSFQNPSKKYLVQEGLHLARYKGTIFDIRVYMQKPYSKWVISGMVARVAAPNLYVTNYQKGGHGEPLDKVLSKLFQGKGKVNKSMSKIKNLSDITARTLSKKYSHIRELGIDFAIEENGELWILEANRKPGHRLFTQLSNKTMLQTIKKNKYRIKKFHS
jgi:hypothetical protein